MKTESKNNPHLKSFARLKENLSTFENARYDHVRDAVQKWKEDALAAIDAAFEGMNDQAKFKEEMTRLFDEPLPFIGINEVLVSELLSDQELDDTFRRDIPKAQALLDACIDSFEKLRQRVS